MSSGYGGNPAGSPADELRLSLGDTDPCDQLLTDAEVAYYLDKNEGDPLLGAYAAARNLLMRYARAVDESVGPVSISWSQRYSNMKAIVDDLQNRQSTYNAIMWAGGTSRAEVREVEADPDRVRPWFQRNSMDDPTHPNTGDRPRSEVGPGVWDPLLGEPLP